MPPIETSSLPLSPLNATVPESLAGERLDQAAAQLFEDFSRARLQTWIKQGNLTVDDQPAKAKQKLAGGERLRLTPVLEPQGDWLPEDLPLDIVYEDADILVLNKGPNTVVHPAAGNQTGTLLNALLHHCAALEALPRGGIVHRLDKDTTGLMVVAKTLTAHQALVAQLQARQVGRHYLAVVVGLIETDGTVNALVGRHPRQRQKMAVLKAGGKQAITHYHLLQRFARHSYIRLKLETGRTHQIRVHMQSIGHPLVGDPLYGGKGGGRNGGRAKTARVLSPELAATINAFPRQALHATRLELRHPSSRETMFWEVPVPADMAALISALSGVSDE